MCAGEGGRDDQLQVRIDRHVTPLAVKAARGGLVPVAGVGVDARHDPIPRHPPGDRRRVLTLIQILVPQILARHRCQQRRRLADRRLKLARVERHQQRAGVLRQRVDQSAPGAAQKRRPAVAAAEQLDLARAGSSSPHTGLPAPR